MRIRIVVLLWSVLASTSVVAAPSSRSVEAATETAASTQNICREVRPFYWEMGTAEGKVVGVSVGLLAPTATRPMNVASASKWLYGAYVAQVLDGQLRVDVDVPFLTFISTTPRLAAGRSSECRKGRSTVHGCNLSGDILGPLGLYLPRSPKQFVYQPGHLEAHADYAMGLGAATVRELEEALEGRLHVDLSFTSVNVAGGVRMAPGEYAKFLRGLMTGSLKLGGLLGTSSVCATAACGNTGDSPWFLEEPAHYSLAHWVEPDEGPEWSGGFSSAGLLGFYPWISKDRSTYLVVASEHLLGAVTQRVSTPLDETPSGRAVLCGRLIKKAYFTGQPQSGAPRK
ncbi:hypothetical protein LZ198_19735 [Myxococcus sp. K15C18031901]|uniref:hypothetical protein n=1 Tax=Myxococcus dinghuensis TaxID=2906761 RepID=UPI0020A836D2|nr:hypothetical protein [Myxococcus dinghuensis]MCP3101110.1 hypothetical protein [Myxococcus dinghuensis]